MKNTLKSNRKEEIYGGFEQGPIRPPSEADSLLIRVTRNCPWNRCAFCPVYKGSRFSLRPVDHVIKDIDMVHGFVDMIRKQRGRIDRNKIFSASRKTEPGEMQAMNAAFHWHLGGFESVFIQDANSLIIKPPDLVKILSHLKNRFPFIERITSYARSHTIARISDGDLLAIREAGLNRIHIGLESGSDRVLKMVKKGVTKAAQIKAGLKVKKAGMELSEYVMPGLGGKALSEEHAMETADALNQINPHFIRLRTLAVSRSMELIDAQKSGRFEKCSDIETVREILSFIENLDGITSTIRSDHILNLFQDVEGVLPGDKEKMTSILKRFLDMDPKRQCVYQVGRRMGLFSGLHDMDNPLRLQRAENACATHGITPENVDGAIDELMKRFI